MEALSKGVLLERMEKEYVYAQDMYNKVSFVKQAFCNMIESSSEDGLFLCAGT